jgi:hypothetical protein
MQASELKKARHEAQILGLSPTTKTIDGQRILEIRTPKSGTLLRFWSPEQWAEYNVPALALRKKGAAVV